MGINIYYYNVCRKGQKRNKTLIAVACEGKRRRCSNSSKNYSDPAASVAVTTLKCSYHYTNKFHVRARCADSGESLSRKTHLFMRYT